MKRRKQRRIDWRQYPARKIIPSRKLMLSEIIYATPSPERLRGFGEMVIQLTTAPMLKSVGARAIRESQLAYLTVNHRALLRGASEMLGVDVEKIENAMIERARETEREFLLKMLNPFNQ